MSFLSVACGSKIHKDVVSVLFQKPRQWPICGNNTAAQVSPAERMRRELAEASKAAYEASRFPTASKAGSSGDCNGAASVMVHSDATAAAQWPVQS